MKHIVIEAADFYVYYNLPLAEGNKPRIIKRDDMGKPIRNAKQKSEKDTVLPSTVTFTINGIVDLTNADDILRVPTGGVRNVPSVFTVNVTRQWESVLDALMSHIGNAPIVPGNTSNPFEGLFFDAGKNELQLLRDNPPLAIAPVETIKKTVAVIRHYAIAKAGNVFLIFSVPFSAFWIMETNPVGQKILKVLTKRFRADDVVNRIKPFPVRLEFIGEFSRASGEDNPVILSRSSNGQHQTITESESPEKTMEAMKNLISGWTKESVVQNKPEVAPLPKKDEGPVNITEKPVLDIRHYVVVKAGGVFLIFFFPIATKSFWIMDTNPAGQKIIKVLGKRFSASDFVYDPNSPLRVEFIGRFSRASGSDNPIVLTHTSDGHVETIDARETAEKTLDAIMRLVHGWTKSVVATQKKNTDIPPQIQSKESIEKTKHTYALFYVNQKYVICQLPVDISRIWVTEEDPRVSGIASVMSKTPNILDLGLKIGANKMIDFLGEFSWETGSSDPVNITKTRRGGKIHSHTFGGDMSLFVSELSHIMIYEATEHIRKQVNPKRIDSIVVAPTDNKSTMTVTDKELVALFSKPDLNIDDFRRRMIERYSDKKVSFEGNFSLSMIDGIRTEIFRTELYLMLCNVAKKIRSGSVFDIAAFEASARQKALSAGIPANDYSSGDARGFVEYYRKKLEEGGFFSKFFDPLKIHPKYAVYDYYSDPLEGRQEEISTIEGGVYVEVVDKLSIPKGCFSTLDPLIPSKTVVGAYPGFPVSRSVYDKYTDLVGRLLGIPRKIPEDLEYPEYDRAVGDVVYMCISPFTQTFFNVNIDLSFDTKEEGEDDMSFAYAHLKECSVDGADGNAELIPGNDGMLYVVMKSDDNNNQSSMAWFGRDIIIDIRANIVRIAGDFGKAVENSMFHYKKLDAIARENKAAPLSHKLLYFNARTRETAEGIIDLPGRDAWVIERSDGGFIHVPYASYYDPALYSSLHDEDYGATKKENLFRKLDRIPDGFVSIYTDSVENISDICIGRITVSEIAVYSDLVCGDKDIQKNAAFDKKLEKALSTIEIGGTEDKEKTEEEKTSGPVHELCEKAEDTMALAMFRISEPRYSKITSRSVKSLVSVQEGEITARYKLPAWTLIDYYPALALKTEDFEAISKKRSGILNGEDKKALLQKHTERSMKIGDTTFFTFVNFDNPVHAFKCPYYGIKVLEDTKDNRKKANVSFALIPTYTIVSQTAVNNKTSTKNYEKKLAGDLLLMTTKDIEKDDSLCMVVTLDPYIVDLSTMPITISGFKTDEKHNAVVPRTVIKEAKIDVEKVPRTFIPFSVQDVVIELGQVSSGGNLSSIGKKDNTSSNLLKALEIIEMEPFDYISYVDPVFLPAGLEERSILSSDKAKAFLVIERALIKFNLHKKEKIKGILDNVVNVNSGTYYGVQEDNRARAKRFTVEHIIRQHFAEKVFSTSNSDAIAELKRTLIGMSSDGKNYVDIATFMIASDQSIVLTYEQVLTPRQASINLHRHIFLTQLQTRMGRYRLKENELVPLMSEEMINDENYDMTEFLSSHNDSQEAVEFIIAEAISRQKLKELAFFSSTGDYIYNTTASPSASINSEFVKAYLAFMDAERLKAVIGTRFNVGSIVDAQMQLKDIDHNAEYLFANFQLRLQMFQTVVSILEENLSRATGKGSGKKQKIDIGLNNVIKEELEKIIKSKDVFEFYHQYQERRDSYGYDIRNDRVWEIVDEYISSNIDYDVVLEARRAIIRENIKSNGKVVHPHPFNIMKLIQYLEHVTENEERMFLVRRSTWPRLINDVIDEHMSLYSEFNSILMGRTAFLKDREKLEELTDVDKEKLDGFLFNMKKKIMEEEKKLSEIPLRQIQSHMKSAASEKINNDAIPMSKGTLDKLITDVVGDICSGYRDPEYKLKHALEAKIEKVVKGFYVVRAEALVHRVLGENVLLDVFGYGIQHMARAVWLAFKAINALIKEEEDNIKELNEKQRLGIEYDESLEILAEKNIKNGKEKQRMVSEKFGITVPYDDRIEPAIISIVEHAERILRTKYSSFFAALDSINDLSERWDAQKNETIRVLLIENDNPLSYNRGGEIEEAESTLLAKGYSDRDEIEAAINRIDNTIADMGLTGFLEGDMDIRRE